MILDYGALYIEIHDRRNGKYAGGKVRRADVVIDLVKRTGPSNLLDYGSGKGYQYLVERLHEEWGGVLPYCYDVGVRQLARRPTGRFDGIICSDVMEHIDEQDVDEVLADIFGFSAVRRDPAYRLDPPAMSFVYFHICCAPAKGSFPDGRNFHLTVQPPTWWRARIERFQRPGLLIETRFAKDAE